MRKLRSAEIESILGRVSPHSAIMGVRTSVIDPDSIDESWATGQAAKEDALIAGSLPGKALLSPDAVKDPPLASRKAMTGKLPPRVDVNAILQFALHAGSASDAG